MVQFIYKKKHKFWSLEIAFQNNELIPSIEFGFERIFFKYHYRLMF